MGTPAEDIAVLQQRADDNDKRWDRFETKTDAFMQHTTQAVSDIRVSVAPLIADRVAVNGHGAVAKEVFQTPSSALVVWLQGLNWTKITITVLGLLFGGDKAMDIAKALGGM